MDLRIRSKQGHPDTSKEARKFIDRIYKEYPEWYQSTEREVFYRSAPFGAQLPPEGE
jgi:recombinational DNA repair protein (RecF pathway)